jgi:hypothetical protein
MFFHQFNINMILKNHTKILFIETYWIPAGVYAEFSSVRK